MSYPFDETWLSLLPSFQVFPQPHPLLWSLLTPAVNLNPNPNRQIHLEGSFFAPKWLHSTLKSRCKCIQIGLETDFPPQNPPNGGSWGPSQPVNQSSNQSINHLTNKLLMDWLLKGRSCGCQFGPTLSSSADCSDSSEKQNALIPPPPFFFPIPPSIHQSIGPSVHSSFPSSQLLPDIRLMACSSLCLSLCLRQYPSRSNAVRICRDRGET